MKHIRAALLLLFVLFVHPLASFADEGTRIERGNLILENVPEIPAALRA